MRRPWLTGDCCSKEMRKKIGTEVSKNRLSPFSRQLSMVFGKMAPTYKNITSQDSRNHMSTHILNVFYINILM
jgi:hypothetical protein